MSIFVNDTLLTREEAAAKLAVSAQRVSALCSNHLLTTYAFGSRKILISLDSVNRYKQQNSKSGRAYDPSLAFAALFMLSGCEVSWMICTPFSGHISLLLNHIARVDASLYLTGGIHPVFF